MLIFSDKVLYVSDLDGTLLLPNEKLSEFTRNALNDMIGQGMYFSYATARSFVTASKVTSGLNAQFPAIVYNGAFIVDNKTNEMLLANYFHPDDIVIIRNLLAEAQIFPIVYAHINGAEKFSSYRANAKVRGFLATRKGDVRENSASDIDELYSGKVFYFTCIDADEKLAPAYEALRDKYHCIFHKDIYTGDRWLEILPPNATKATAMRKLKAHLHCDRIVAFGDGKNDLSMFQIADECYAVENAVAELKALATGVIGSNTEDGVVKWLRQNAR